MRMSVLLASAGVVTALAAACQREDAATTVEAFCADRAQAECERLQGPCALPALDVCVATRRRACAEWATVLNVGMHKFRSQRTRECLDKVRLTLGASVPVAAIDDVDATCARVFEGAATVNATCAYDFDCVSPLTCDGIKGGLCSTRREVVSGGGCANPGEVCRAGEFCGPLVTAQGTTLLVCTARSGLGAACSSARPCLETLRCLPDGACGPRLGIGNACASDDDCATSFCDPYVRVCADGLHFAPGSASCVTFAGQGVGGGTGQWLPVDAASGN